MNNQAINKVNNNLVSILIAIFIVLLGCLIVLTGVFISNNIKQGRYIGQNIETKNTIQVSGKGVVYTRPDLALVTLSVKSERKQISDALKENTLKMNAISAFLKQQGVAKEDLKSTSLNIAPHYEYQTQGIPVTFGKRILVGYEVSQSLQVKIRDFKKIGIIIKGATDKGANQIGNLRFTIDQPDELKMEAREQAIKQAKLQAKNIASQLGIHLVRITNFRENNYFPRYYTGSDNAIPLANNQEVPKVEAGTNLSLIHI